MLKWKITPYVFYLIGCICYIFAILNFSELVFIGDSLLFRKTFVIYLICGILSFFIGLLIMLYQYVIRVVK